MPALTASIQVKGLKELDAMLARLADGVEGAIMDAALREAGGVILRAAQRNIPKRTARTAADLRMEVQVQPGRQQGVAAIGGTTGKQGRAHILRWLEFGTARHPIVAGKSAKREAREQVKALRQLGPAAFARALERARELGVKPKKFARALKLPGGAFRAAVQHPGTRSQSPLTRALAEHGDRALKVFAAALWRGIVQMSQRFPKAA